MIRSRQSANLPRRDLLKAGSGLAAGALLPSALRTTEAAAATPGTLVVAAPATPQSLDSNFDVSLGTFEAVAALYDNLLEFKKIPDPKVPGAFREDIADHPDMPGGVNVQGKLAESFELDPNGTVDPLPAAQGRQEQLGQRADRRRREVDVGPQVRPEGDRRVLPLHARPGEAGGREGRRPLHGLDQPRPSRTRCWSSCSRTCTRRSTTARNARKSPPPTTRGRAISSRTTRPASVPTGSTSCSAASRRCSRRGRTTISASRRWTR